MRYITVDKLQENMVICKPIFNEESVLLLGATKKLSNRNIQDIKKLGYQGLYIYDEFTGNEYIEDLVSSEVKQGAYKSLKNADIDSVIYYSNKIVEDLRSSKRLCIELVSLKSFDDYTYAHSINVGTYAAVCGIGFGMNDTELKELVLSGLLHDIGKTKIPLSVLNKQGRLTESERLILNSHPQLGYDIIKDNIDISARVKQCVLLHHENEDGSGYPYGWPGKKTTLYTKIIHTVDVYDALLSDRPYKKRCSHAESLEYLMGGCGTLFNREVVDIFLKYVVPYPIGIEVELSTGDKAIVMKTNDTFIQRPIVRLLSNGQDIDLSEPINYNLTIIKVSI